MSAHAPLLSSAGRLSRMQKILAALPSKRCSGWGGQKQLPLAWSAVATRAFQLRGRKGGRQDQVLLSGRTRLSNSDLAGSL